MGTVVAFIAPFRDIILNDIFTERAYQTYDVFNDLPMNIKQIFYMIGILFFAIIPECIFF